jgi:hypothetical protein
MARFEDVAEFLETCTSPGGASERTISSAEETLGVRFPTSYRKFLGTLGAALCAGFEIAGLYDSPAGEEPPLWIDVVKSTLRLRGRARGLSNGYVAISGDGGDYTYFLDTRLVGEDGECPVIALGPGVDGVVIADNFADFVLRSVEDRIVF